MPAFDPVIKINHKNTQTDICYVGLPTKSKIVQDDASILKIQQNCCCFTVKWLHHSLSIPIPTQPPIPVTISESVLLVE